MTCRKWPGRAHRQACRTCAAQIWEFRPLTALPQLSMIRRCPNPRDSSEMEWDVRALVGHTSRALLTVETYLARPAAAVDIASAPGYFRATRAAAAGPAVAVRGRDAGTALGSDPAAAVAEIAARVLALVDTQNGDEVVATIAGGMRLGDYLPTRTFELAVHTADLATTLGAPLDVPASAAAQALHIVADLALTSGLAGPLLLAATGRPGLPAGFSVL